MQFVPEDGVYVYFRYDTKQTVMCVMNTNEKEVTLNTARFVERIQNFLRGRDVTSNIVVNLKDLKVQGKKLMVLELQ